ncbi:hypothetical protein [Butyrivibrio sp. AC2005]|uniref:hypothetical protein n=1 Tax=Butyrivibrio sp. AC2005 TaxID=1280672 RepID=UPI0003F6810D|nr:hypothetical protein [Butyrivibrio sp. AC2005]
MDIKDLEQEGYEVVETFSYPFCSYLREYIPYEFGYEVRAEEAKTREFLEEHGYEVSEDFSWSEVAGDMWWDVAYARMDNFTNDIDVLENEEGKRIWHTQGWLYAADDNSEGLAYDLYFDHKPDEREILDKICALHDIDMDYGKIILERCSRSPDVRKIEDNKYSNPYL